ncbi:MULTISPECIES: hypothetical protein [unclassified Spirosoma]|uniref:hypothetical protein n=1 Tax=unclassified Spirosoma TaxID=2621999 RepID=UPI00095BEB1D|nr:MULTISPECIES: hypothetical protein [unclassified Spirosoma]MBN8826460.1 hypothetical protein [Spirosoma sp.]OJW76447.1 MAG: hypothetical protein BGO59_23320 [Spirosoma sp. 48-14]
MATPIGFIEQNDTFTTFNGETYPVWYRANDKQGFECVSVWEFSPEELEVIKDTATVFVRFYNQQPYIYVGFGEPVDFEGKSLDVKANPELGIDLPAYKELTTFNGKPAVSITSAWQLSPEGLRWVLTHGYVSFVTVGYQRDCQLYGICPIEF